MYVEPLWKRKSEVVSEHRFCLGDAIDGTMLLA